MRFQVHLQTWHFTVIVCCLVVALTLFRPFRAMFFLATRSRGGAIFGRFALPITFHAFSVKSPPATPAGSDIESYRGAAIVRDDEVVRIIGIDPQIVKVAVRA